MQPNIRPKSSPRRRKPLPEGGNRSRQATAGADLEFGRFRVLLRRRQLLADGVPVALGTRVFDLLLALLEADGALLTKEQLMSRVWPGVVVSEENVKFQIAALRKVTRRGAGDDPHRIRARLPVHRRAPDQCHIGALRANVVKTAVWPRFFPT